MSRNTSSASAAWCKAPVHPRGRCNMEVDPVWVVASSRVIPAREKRGRPWSRSRRASSVHPRVGGERRGTSHRDPGRFGSSPCGRGTPLGGRGGRMCVRFMPALAGNTDMHRCGAISDRGSSPVSVGTTRAVHPASHRALVHPPHAWGILDSPEQFVVGAPVIPARAGNTAGADHTAQLDPVHPRVRGEHTAIRCRCGEASGSSPLARGTLGGAFYGSIVAGFISACAGNTSIPSRSLTLLGGSSPRARGTHRGCGAAVEYARVHPRARGEHETQVFTCVSAHGPFPRWRGTSGLDRASIVGRRVIPV